MSRNRLTEEQRQIMTMTTIMSRHLRMQMHRKTILRLKMEVNPKVILQLELKMNQILILQLVKKVKPKIIL